MVGSRVKLLSGVAVAALALSSPALAQGRQQPALPSWLPEVTSGISVTEQYDDNIYATRTSKVPDWITLISPFANLRFRGDKGEFNLGGNATIGRYASHSDEDFNDFSLYGNGRYTISPMLSVSGGTAYDHLHESRSSPNARPGVTPTIYDVIRAYGATLLTLGDNTVRLGATFDRFNYHNVARVGGGTVNNNDRDRDVATAGVRVGHNIDKENEVFGLFSYDNRNYRLPVDDFGYQKDSSGVRFSGGWRHRVSPTLDGEVYVGGIYQRYDDPRFSSVFVPDFGGRVTWTGIPRTTVTATLDRTLQETDIQAASGYIETAALLNITHWIRPNLRVYGELGYNYDQFNGIARTDQVQSFGIGHSRLPY